MMSFAGKWMEIEIMLSELSWPDRKYQVFSHLWKLQENQPINNSKNQGHES
jgi:hypothetical protein